MTYDWRAEEIKKAKKSIEEDSYTDSEGVIRWKSNDRVPFDDLLENAGVDTDTRQRCRVARDADTEKTLSEYREAMKNHVPSDEEMYEMRAAFGPGAKVVNVITGKVTQL